MSAEKFQNKYRIPSARLASWNYGWAAHYFITICTQGKEHFFGKIIDGKMHLSDIGEIVKREWLNTEIIRADMDIDTSCFVIMPNHFHAIVGIAKNKFNTAKDTKHWVAIEDGIQNQFGPQSKNLASILRGFKAAVTKSACLHKPNFAWQTRFHDHIIRDRNEFIQISHYIEQNPANWSDDKFHQP